MDHDEEKILQVLIYEASCKLTPFLCYYILKENHSNPFRIRFHFLETNEHQFEIAMQHCATVQNCGSRVLKDILVTKNPKIAFENIDYAIILPSVLFDQEVDCPKIYDGKFMCLIFTSM